MKKIVFFMLMVSLAVGCSKSGSVNLTIASYNIRYENNRDYAAGNGWDIRYPYICSILRYESPDIFGAQEVLHDQLEDMKTVLPAYDCVGVGRDDGKEKGEYEPIFWKKDRFTLKDKGWFWLSETPDSAGLGWDAACIRICTWTLLKEKESGRMIRFFNMHMDHVGVVARRESAKLIVAKVQELCKDGEQVFITGDYNVDQNNEIYDIFSAVLDDSYVTALDRHEPDGSFNGFDPDNFTESRIDHIFTTRGTKVYNYAVLTETYRSEVAGAENFRTGDFPQELSFKRYRARVPSDHFPVFIKVEI